MGTADHDRAVELLKQLGLKTYQAECFAALNAIPNGTAREISDVADVPRTRVYDATEALAEQGFVEVQHTNPQRFRAIPLEEAVQTLREQYEVRIEQLHATLERLEAEGVSPEGTSREVWSVESEGPLDARVAEAVADADETVVLVVGEACDWAPAIGDAVTAAASRDVAVDVISLPSADLPIEESDKVTTVSTEVSWLAASDEDGRIGRLLLVDGDTAIVTTLDEDGDDGEHAIVAEGSQNGAVVLCRRMLAEAVRGAEPMH